MAHKWVCPATLFFSILFVGLFFCCNSAKPRDREKREAYIHPVSDIVITCARKVRGAGKQTDSDTKKTGCSILEDFHLGPERTPTLYFAGKKGCQKVFNINHRWKYLQTIKIRRLQKATISSGQRLCRFK